MDVSGSVALITGGARMGKAIAVRLAARRADLVLAYQSSKQSAEEIVKEVQALGQRADAIHADLAKKGTASRVIAKVKTLFRRLDILVHMVSIYREAPPGKLTRGEWQRNQDANLTSAYELAVSAEALMKKNGRGRIIFVTDWTVASGRPRYRNLLPYYVAKSGLQGLTEVLALELAPMILVNSIAPGPILPPRGSSARDQREVARATPLKRWGGPEEIAKAVEFLVDTDFVTGESIRVDGGRHLY